MDHGFSISELRSARATRNIMVVVAIALTISVIFQAWALQERSETIVLVPTQLGAETIASGGRIDANYMEALARDASYALLNITPDTTDYARETLGRLSAPVARAEIVELWDSIIDDVRARDISTAFYPRVFEVSVTDKTVVVDGELSTYLGTQRIEKERKRYLVGFGATGGSVRIVKIAELDLPS